MGLNASTTNNTSLLVIEMAASSACAFVIGSTIQGRSAITLFACRVATARVLGHLDFESSVANQLPSNSRARNARMKDPVELRLLNP